MRLLAPPPANDSAPSNSRFGVQCPSQSVGGSSGSGGSCSSGGTVLLCTAPNCTIHAFMRKSATSV